MLTMKVVFLFCGTGAENSDYDNDRVHIKKDVIYVHLKGCQHKEIGGDSVLGFFGRFLFPSLDTAAKNVAQAFDQSKHLSLVKLRKSLGNAISAMYVPKTVSQNAEHISIDSIALVGFSRGAVTCFAAARHLDKLGIPIHVIAHEPVSGHSELGRKLPKTEYSKNSDLRHCKNIASAVVLLNTELIDFDDVSCYFLKQMLPYFPETVIPETYWLPFHYHLDTYSNRDSVQLAMSQINYYLAKNGFVASSSIAKDNVLEAYKFSREYYFFPPKSMRKQIKPYEGDIAKDPFYTMTLKENLIEDLMPYHLDVLERCSLQQLKAIHGIQRLAFKVQVFLSQHDYFSKQKFMSLILSDSVQAKKFCHITNVALDTVFALQYKIAQKPPQFFNVFQCGSPLEDIRLKKSKALISVGLHFQQKVIEAAYEICNKAQPTSYDKQNFINAITVATNHFVKQAAQIHRRPKWQEIGVTLVNIILFAFSVPYKIYSGFWLFEKTSTTDQLEKLQQQLFDLAKQSGDCIEMTDDLQQGSSAQSMLRA